MGSKFPTPAPTDPEHRKPPAPKGPPPMESVTSLQRELAEARNKRDLDMLLCQLGEMATVSDKSAPAPSDVKGEESTESDTNGGGKRIKSDTKLTPLNDPSVRGVLVKCDPADRDGVTLFGILGMNGPHKLRPASDFGVAAREDEAKEQAEAEDYLWNIARTRNETLTRLAAERAERIKELEAELAKRTQERDEAVPFMVALKGRHNGYDPGNSKMFPAGPPETPEVALNELIEEQEWLVNSELQQAQSDAERQGERIKKLEAERQLSPSVEEALSAINRALLFFRQGDQSGCDGMNEREISLASTAGVKVVRNAFATEQSMHSAWRKRATEAESDAERLRKAIKTHRTAMMNKGLDGTHGCDDELWSALTPSPAAENKSNGSQGTHKPATRPQANEAEPAAATEAIVSGAASDPASERIKELEARIKWLEDDDLKGMELATHHQELEIDARADAERLRKAIETHRLEWGAGRVIESNNRLWSALSPSPAAASGERPAIQQRPTHKESYTGPTSAPAAESDKPYGLVEQMDAGEGTVYGRRVTVKRREEPAAETQGNAQHHSEGAKIPGGGSGSSAAESEGSENNIGRIFDGTTVDIRWLNGLLDENSALSARLAACEERCKAMEAGIEKHQRQHQAIYEELDGAEKFDRELWSLLAPKAGGEDGK